MSMFSEHCSLNNIESYSKLFSLGEHTTRLFDQIGLYDDWCLPDLTICITRPDSGSIRH